MTWLSLLRSALARFFLIPIVTITLADVLPVAIVVAVRSIHCKGVDVLAKVGYLKNATSTVHVRIHQVSPEAFEYG